MAKRANKGKIYLLTGATGHVGSVVLSMLHARGERIRALVLPGETAILPAGIELVEGDLAQMEDFSAFFSRTWQADGPDSGPYSLSLIHCAAMVSIASNPGSKMWRVNVDGTDRLMRASLAAGVERCVYVSSVHAIPELPDGQTIREVDSFSPHEVHGLYAKSKAEAARRVLQLAADGLNVSIVHPSGVIGPGDQAANNHMIRVLRAMDRGTIPAGIEGGYDFVDSRDVAQGILACEELGAPGECYLLSGHYVSVEDCLRIVNEIRGRKRPVFVAPAALVRPFARVAELIGSHVGSGKALLTPYSLYTLQTNANFSHEKASTQLGYTTRPIEDSIRDSLI